MQSASDSSAADTPAPPTVRVVIPSRDPGPWFDDVIAAVAAQDYPQLSVTIVHGQDERPLLERHASALPNVEFVECSNDVGFGEKINLVAGSTSEQLLLLHHDDVAMEPGAVSALVREWLRRRNSRNLIAAKLLDWSDQRKLMPAGFDADRFGATTATVKLGDLDQGQQDRIVDIFGSSTACLLVEREFLLSIGGFDAAVDWHGEAHDLALRSRSVGGQVIIAAAATARHRGDFDSRGGPDRAFRERRHQMRSAFGAAPARQLPLLILGFAALHVIEFIVAIARLDLADAASIPAAWLWNIGKAGSLRSRRAAITTKETFSADGLKLVRRRGSIRLSESIDRRISQREIATEAGEATISVVRAAGGIVLGALLVFGARHLLTRPIPVIGEFRALPADLGTLTADWWSGWRPWGMGSEGFASMALPLLDLAGVVTLGSESFLRMLLVVAPIPIGVIGMWRLFSRSGSDRAPVAAAFLYAASPLPYNAVAGGSAQALILYALLPWVFAQLVAITGSQAFGPTRGRNGGVVSLLATLVVVVAFSPFAAGVIAVVVVGVLLGSLLSGDMRGVPALFAGAGVAIAGAVVFNLPFVLGLGSWELFAGAQGPGATDTPLSTLLTLTTGAVGSSVLGWAVFAPALFPLLSAAGERFSWAMRVWGAMLLTWAIAWAAVRGWLPVGLPVLEVVLGPAALGFAILAGLSAMAIDVDLEGAKPRRLLPAVVAAVGLGLALFPLLDGSFSGRWELARVDLSTTYGAIEAPPEEGTYRVVWIGDAHVLGAASIATANDLAWTSSLDGVPDVRALFGGPNTGATAELTDAISAGLDGRTSRLGRELSKFGVRYIVVMDQQAPIPEVSRRSLVSDVRAAGLNGQLDLVRTGVVNPAVIVYRNTAWAPVHSAVAPATLEPLQIADPAPAVVARDSHVEWSGQTRAERSLFASWEPSSRWTLEIDDNAMSRVDVGTVGMGFDTSSAGGATNARFVYNTADSHRLILGLQAAAWVALIGLRRWLVGQGRRVARRDLARSERVG